MGRKINVLSLFDGMSCGRIALERAGIEVGTYFASEIDKWAIKVSENNYPEIEHIGDVQDVGYEQFTLYSGESNAFGSYRYQNIDLLIGGSPCQGFSFAGKQLNFEDPRSKLFFEFERLLREVKPKYFILENVRMKHEYERFITQRLDWVEPILINSSLVSAQNRERLYWVGELQKNGKYRTVDISQPEDKYIFLKDILENKVDDKYYMSETILQGFLRKGSNFNGKFKITEPEEKGACLTTKSQGSLVTQTYIVGNTNPSGKGQNGNVYDEDNKSPTLTTNKGEGIKILQRPRGVNRGYSFDKKVPPLTTSDWQQNNILYIPEGNKEGFTEIYDGDCFDGNRLNSPTRRGRKMDLKSNCLTVAGKDFMRYENGRIRKLTPIECERLQTVPDNYTKGVSNSQRYKMLGNGWTVDVITHIIKHLDL